MTERSFFEYLGIANSERIHTQTLAWIFSPNFDAISEEQRLDVIRKIFNVELSGNITRVVTEYENIDLYIETSDNLIIVENKLKSSQHSDQLERYTKLINAINRKKSNFRFLTLVNEKPQNDNWENITYLRVCEVLSTLNINASTKSSVIFSEYLLYLKKLTESLAAFTENPRTYKCVFSDGSKKKSEKNSHHYTCPIERFISENQLETIYQISFLRSVSKQINGFKSWVFESRGSAILDVEISSSLVIDNKKYKTMIELQGKAIKFAVIVIGKENYEKSNPQWIKTLIPEMSRLAISNEFGYKKVNPPKTRAYMSISKKLEIPYWEMSTLELSEYLITEANNAKQMSTALIHSMA